MPMDLFIAYKLQKRVEKGLREEREKNLLKEKKDLNETEKDDTERDETDVKSVKKDCSKCGQNQMWCVCSF